VDDYLAACKKLKQAPNRPVSGRVMLRLPPDVHARARAAAEVTGMSFNQWATRALEHAAGSI
jgi:predicted HicB family RNase H-like nuclease